MNSSLNGSRVPAATPFAATNAATNEVLIVSPTDTSGGGAAHTPCINVASPQQCFEAIEARRPQTFAAIVIDWRLPRDGGAQLLGQLRRQRYPATLIALLPPERPDLGGVAEQAGADGYLLGSQGFPAHLPQVIAAARDRAHLRDENRRLKREVAESRTWLGLREGLIPLAAHQLKNPLTVILGYSSLLLKMPEVGTERRLRSAAATLHRESTRLRQIVEELLEYLRLESADSERARHPFDLAEVVRAVGTRQGDICQLRIDPTISTLPCSGDYSKLAQTLETLLALRASAPSAPPTPRIALACRDAAELAAAGLDERLESSGTYATIAIGGEHGAGLRATAWRPCVVGDVAEPEREMRGLICAAIVRKHGGMLYTTTPAGDGDYLLVLPLLPGVPTHTTRQTGSVGRDFLDRGTDGDGTAGDDTGAQAAAID